MNLKRVKIDEHVKATKSATDQSAPKRKRGRPRKNPIQSSDAQQIGTVGSSFSGDHSIGQLEASSNGIESPKIEPVYDTTEEAKAFIRAPFDIASGLTGIKDLALYPAQLEALTPSFKIVYDKRIAPFMGENADIYALAIVLSGIVFEKVSVFREHTARTAPPVPNKTTDGEGKPFIPHEVIA